MCRSAVLYDGELDGKTRRFGTSGFLYQSNKLMYDLDSNSLWHALTGEPVIGKLAYSGLHLNLLPVTTTTWAEWREAHPDTKVLSLETGFRRAYEHHSDPQSAYYEYFNDPAVMFPVFEHDARLRDKDQVLAVRFDGEARAYLLDALAKSPVLNDVVAGREIVIVTERLSRAARPYERSGHRFTAGASSREALDEQGRVWRVEEDAIVEPVSGERLARLPSHTAYWFGWRAFYPETSLFTGN
ncbi:MAG: DUF3179 domain-containing protein [Chloroflexi bacterium]|nr:DUF3179 domain-containing protein [Chloroflexota bacterium]